MLLSPYVKMKFPFKVLEEIFFESHLQWIKISETQFKYAINKINLRVGKDGLQTSPNSHPQSSLLILFNLNHI